MANSEASGGTSTGAQRHARRDLLPVTNPNPPGRQRASALPTATQLVGSAEELARGVRSDRSRSPPARSAAGSPARTRPGSWPPRRRIEAERHPRTPKTIGNTEKPVLSALAASLNASRGRASAFATAPNHGWPPSLNCELKRPRGNYAHRPALPDGADPTTLRYRFRPGEAKGQ